MNLIERLDQIVGELHPADREGLSEVRDELEGLTAEVDRLRFQRDEARKSCAFWSDELERMSVENEKLNERHEYTGSKACEDRINGLEAKVERLEEALREAMEWNWQADEYQNVPGQVKNQCEEALSEDT